MNEVRSAIEILLETADEALREDLELEEQLAAVEEYCFRFHESQQLIERAAVNKEIDRQLLAGLARKHALILTRAKELMGSTVKDIQKFKKQARGIMAYIDVLPGKLSITKPRKG